MITHTRTKNFKGLSLDEDVPQKVIYSGPNRSGKTAHSENIAIVLYGYVPWSIAGKRPSDVLDSFGDGKELVCAATIGGKEFGRKFSRNDKGVVSQNFQYDGKRTSASNYDIMLHNAGAPKIANVAEFMAQSEAKKVETLFELFPNPELTNIDQEIETAKEDVSRIDKKIKVLDGTIQRLTDSKNDYQLPAGSLPEIQAEIESTNEKISEVEEQIKQAEIEDAEQKAAEIARKQEQERIENEKKRNIEIISQGEIDIEEISLKTAEDWENAGLDSIPDSPGMQEIDQSITKLENGLYAYKNDSTTVVGPSHGVIMPDKNPICKEDASESIQKIINAMTQTGCNACAALIVAKSELKKYES